jgi:ubiquinone/menaquinone biosynthesis C-methylase UbiE
MPLPSEIYDREYYLSERVEGWEHFADGRGISPIKQAELDLLGIEPGLRFMDAGCGRGEVMLAASRMGAEVAGVDYSAAGVEIARETVADVPGAEVVHSDVAELPWPDGSFDRILMGDVVEHLDNEHAVRALAELRRVMRPGGRLLVHTAPNRLFTEIVWPVARVGLRLVGQGKAADGMDFWIKDTRQYHVVEQTLHGLRRHLRQAGFDAPRVWIDPNVLRVGQGHHLTRDLEDKRVMQLANTIVGVRPLRLFLGNDIYALAVRGG